MIKVYGLKVSYFTGKLEGYLRYKEIPYQFVSSTVACFKHELPKNTGAMQVPAVELSDGRWLTDTSPMMDWFESQHPDRPILPADPVQAFVSRLIEDYADEYLWRPAMHYRWSYPASAQLLSRQITDEMAPNVSIPGWLIRRRTKQRQFNNFVAGDGVSEATQEHVEQAYLRLLSILQELFTEQEFVMGQRPSLADFGLFGPLFRHFSMDPTPAVIMRETAPAVMAWVYRLWNAKASEFSHEQPLTLSDKLLPLLKEIGQTHLENLCANADAWNKNQNHFSVELQGTQYQKVPTSQYRVWCLEQLQQQFLHFNEESKGQLQNLLAKNYCLEPLQRIKQPNSDYNPVLFEKGIPVYRQVRG